jgi:hypothetical protein
MLGRNAAALQVSAVIGDPICNLVKQATKFFRR